jgi:hypothetical protein
MAVDLMHLVHAKVTPPLVHFWISQRCLCKGHRLCEIRCRIPRKWSFIHCKILTVTLSPASQLSMEEKLANAKCEGLRASRRGVGGARGANVQACMSGRTNEEAPCPGMIPTMMKCLAAVIPRCMLIGMEPIRAIRRLQRHLVSCSIISLCAHVSVVFDIMIFPSSSSSSQSLQTRTIYTSEVRRPRHPNLGLISIDFASPRQGYQQLQNRREGEMEYVIYKDHEASEYHPSPPCPCSCAESPVMIVHHDFRIDWLKLLSSGAKAEVCSTAATCFGIETLVHTEMHPAPTGILKQDGLMSGE